MQERERGGVRIERVHSSIGGGEGGRGGGGMDDDGEETRSSMSK